MSEVSIKEIVGDLFDNMIVISFPECTERSLEGFTCKENESLTNAVNRQLADNEICCYRSEGYSQRSWDIDKATWLEDYNSRTNLFKE